MSWRTVVVSSRSKLELKNGYLVIRNDVVKRVHLEEVSTLIIENTGSATTVALLAELWKYKVNVILCDEKRNPGAQIIPFYNSFDCSARVEAQIHWADDIKEAVWTEIVKEKIRQQSAHLSKCGYSESSQLLDKYYCDVVQGDYTNREGHAARVYFNTLFGNTFSRSSDCFVNAALNYGYGIILSAVNREVVANGYLTQLGLFHHNVFNQFNLSCDLMEPFRPVVDYIVRRMEPHDTLEHSDKLKLVDVFNTRVLIKKSKQTVQNALSIYVKSVLDALDNRDLSLINFFEYDFSGNESNSVF